MSKIWNMRLCRNILLGRDYGLSSTAISIYCRDAAANCKLKPTSPGPTTSSNWGGVLTAFRQNTIPDFQNVYFIPSAVTAREYSVGRENNLKICSEEIVLSPLTLKNSCSIQ